MSFRDTKLDRPKHFKRDLQNKPKTCRISTSFQRSTPSTVEFGAIASQGAILIIIILILLILAASVQAGTLWPLHTIATYSDHGP